MGHGRRREGPEIRPKRSLQAEEEGQRLGLEAPLPPPEEGEEEVAPSPPSRELPPIDESRLHIVPKTQLADGRSYIVTNQALYCEELRPRAAHFSFQWMRFKPSKPDKVDLIQGARESVYTPSADDAGFMLRLQCTPRQGPVLHVDTDETVFPRHIHEIKQAHEAGVRARPPHSRAVRATANVHPAGGAVAAVAAARRAARESTTRNQKSYE